MDQTKDTIEVLGQVKEVLPNTLFRVEIIESHDVAELVRSEERRVGKEC